MLPKTEEILTKYRELNRKEFSETASDFRPFDGGKDGAYGEFDEISEIYALMKTLSITLDQQIYFGQYSNAYSNPLEPIKIIQDLNSNLKSHISALQSINDKYDGKVLPVLATLKNYLKTSGALDYVLNLKEVKTELGDLKKEKLTSELLELKVEKAFRKKQIKIFGVFTFYAVCLLLPIIMIIVFWSNHQNGKWFQLGLFLFPIISFLYDKDSFKDMLKFSLLKKSRTKYKTDLKRELRNTYI